MEQTAAKILLKKFLENKCSAKELELVRELMQQPGTDQILHQIMLEQDGETWAKSLQEDQQSALVIAGLKQKVFNQIDNNTHLKEQAGSIKKLHFWRYAAIWAVLAIGIGSYYLISRDKETTNKQIALLERKNPFGQRSKIILPDGSEIYLGAGSKVTFPERFVGNTREISLEGEAFFEVKKDHSHPFIVHAGTIQTRVLGTSFKINAFKGEVLTVAVATGRVGVSQHQNGKAIPLAVLTPGHKVSWNSQTKSVIPGNVEVDNLKNWQQGKLVFDNVPLEQVTRELERWYNVSINFTDHKIATYRVNATFSSDESIDQVMKVLSIGGKFNYTTKNNKSFHVFKKK